MPIIGIPQTSVALNSSTGNILAGKAFEFVGRATARLAIVAASTGLTMQIVNGTEIIAQQEAVPLKAGLNLTTPDDYHTKWIARGRQQIVVTNTTGAAIIFVALLELQPI
jgi:hypothetical protein